MCTDVGAQTPSLCQELKLSPNPASTLQEVTASITCSCSVAVEIPVIEKTENSVAISYAINDLCLTTPPTVRSFHLGKFSPGVYTVSITQTSSLSGNVLEFNTGSLRVVSTSVPILDNLFSRILMIVSLLLLAFIALKRCKITL